MHSPNPIRRTSAYQATAVPRENFEISALRLRGGCSSSELPRHVRVLADTLKLDYLSVVGVGDSQPYSRAWVHGESNSGLHVKSMRSYHYTIDPSATHHLG